MCSGSFFGGGSAPGAPAVQPVPQAPALVAPIGADEGSSRAADDERRRRKAASGRSDTLLNGAQGVAPGQTGSKQLLGQ